MALARSNTSQCARPVGTVNAEGYKRICAGPFSSSFPLLFSLSVCFSVLEATVAEVAELEPESDDEEEGDREEGKRLRVVRCSAGSGKRRSKQIRLPNRPMGDGIGGINRDPACVLADSRSVE